jgi:plastocyanin
MTIGSLSRPLLRVALVTALVLGAAACGDDEDPATSADGGTGEDTPGDDYGSTTGGSTDGGASGDTPSVVAQGIAFADDLTVGPGDDFLFDNQDSTTHTLTADDGEFDSGEVPGGNQSDPITAPDEPGSYSFHCEIHGSMTGTLTVGG